MYYRGDRIFVDDWNGMEKFQWSWNMFNIRE